MNPRTTIGSKLLCSLILCLGTLFTAQSAKAGPILAFPQSGYGETAEAFRARVMHGAIMGNAVHMLTPAAPGSMFWDITIQIAEVDGGAGTDSVVVVMTARHKVGVPGHNMEGGNPAQLTRVFVTAALVPGANPFALPVMTVNHPPIAGHTDQFGGTLIFTVAMNGRDITAYTLNFFGVHCSPQCPELPPIDKQLQDIPEWNALMLFGSGLAGLLGYCRKRLK